MTAVPTRSLHSTPWVTACALAATATAACGRAAPERPATERLASNAVPRGIVLVIGDGMGTAHFTLAKLLRKDNFQIARLPQSGLVTTASASSLVTDSAAAATALSTGVKTTNGFIALDPAGRPLTTVLELAESRGLATGLVTTAAFGDATPAAFAAHSRNRKDAREIYPQIVSRGIDVLASTGLDKLGADGVPALDELAAPHGYTAVSSAAELRATGAAPVLAVLPSGELDAESPALPLHELAAWSIERLAGDPDGMFLLVEHEGTDTASHHHATAQLATSLRAFDQTVGAVLDLAAPRDLLVVVLGDHETGGLRLADHDDAARSMESGDGEPRVTWATDGHTGEAVPVFAAGPGAERFTGVLDNTDVGNALRALVTQMGLRVVHRGSR